ncbi:MAG: hypothetical protein HY369_04580 [Candidatus Aenigmarchaeota archaeon]|nr:hypothetical protein [Candidatus Aenigmarchaeota archaeon]
MRDRHWDLYSNRRFQDEAGLDTAPFRDLEIGEIYWLFPSPETLRTYRAICRNMARYFGRVRPPGIGLPIVKDESVPVAGLLLGQEMAVTIPSQVMVLYPVLTRAVSELPDARQLFRGE